MTYLPGDHWKICDQCGFKKRKSQTRKMWNGLIVCRDTCFETRHPQDFVKARKDKQIVKDARPRQTEKFISTANPITADDL
jgi:hypothetical protein